jgi:hypothetical protein
MPRIEFGNKIENTAKIFCRKLHGVGLQMLHSSPKLSGYENIGVQISGMSNKHGEMRNSYKYFVIKSKGI